MAVPDSCSTAGCSDPATVQLELQRFCIPHFIGAAYDRLDECGRAVADHQFQESSAEATWVLLVECIERAADLTQNAETLDNLQRARLLDILLRSAELSRHLRRGPRKALAIPVLLRCEKLGRAWEEETTTRILSRHGVMLDCEHAAEAGDRLTVIRLDTKEEVKTRIAWQRPVAGGRHELGIEFLSADNFWGLKWDTAEHSVDQRDWSFKPPA